MPGPNDAYLWTQLADALHGADIGDTQGRLRTARQLVAVVRRGRSTARTWAPGDTIPYDVAKVTDLDGDVWVRQSTDPDSTLRDSWKMRDFDPDEHEPACEGVWVTPFLLDEYGPLTEVFRR